MQIVKTVGLVYAEPKLRSNIAAYLINRHPHTFNANYSSLSRTKFTPKMHRIIIMSPSSFKLNSVLSP